METEAMKSALMTFFRRNYSYFADEIKEDESLIASGYIDSLGIIELINYLENTFNIRIYDSEVIPENFDTIRCISEYIQRKVAVSSGNGR